MRISAPIVTRATRRALASMAAFVLLGVLVVTSVNTQTTRPASVSAPADYGTVSAGLDAATPKAATSLPSSPLSAFLASQATGYVAAGTGMRDRGYGTITIAGIPTGAVATSAFLFWDVLGGASPLPSYAAGKFAGTSITGTEIGTGGDPCWGNSANFAYKADVSSLVTGNGSYALTGFASGRTDGGDPWTDYRYAPPMMEGASLVVVYDVPGSPTVSISLWQGSEMAAGGALTQTLSGFTAPANAAARTTFIVADGQDASKPDSMFNGNDLPGLQMNGKDPQSGPAFSEGDLWDTASANVGSFIAQGDKSATATLEAGDDCLVWVGQVLSVGSPGTGVPGSLPSVLPYVAMGDSYSSGYMNTPYDTGTDIKGVDQCDRSAAAYPRVLNLPTQVVLLHVACAGAVTSNITSTSQYPPSELPQIDYLGQAIRLVTVTIGGNDAGFKSVMESCVRIVLGCNRSGEDAKIAALANVLPGVYRSMLSHAPNAQIYVLDYPNIFPSDAEVAGTCDTISRSDLDWLIGETWYLDSVIQTAVQQVASARLHLVDVFSAFAGHEICTSPASATEAWGWTGLSGFHPNAAGHARLAAILRTVIETTFS